MSGDVYATGSLAYVPQAAWIPNDSVRNNIIFGKEFDEARYRRVVEVCRLERDLKVRRWARSSGVPPVRKLIGNLRTRTCGSSCPKVRPEGRLGWLQIQEKIFGGMHTTFM